MNVLMFGWEFPPYKSGGLGTACHDLTKGLSKQGVNVTFVMPVVPKGARATFVNLVGANTYPARFVPVDSLLTPYATPETYQAAYTSAQQKGSASNDVYGKNLFLEVQRFAATASSIAREQEHDLIHAHDWMTYPAALQARKKSGKPLVMHIHATEYDRTLGKPNKTIYSIERAGLLQANAVIANSNFLKKTVVDHYRIPAQKIRVVHWGIDQDLPVYKTHYRSNIREKIVLYLGRMTVMKGPDHFLHVARRVLAYEPHTKFVMVGGGEMFPHVVKLAADLGITQHVIFTGPLSGEATHQAFQLADLFVMPSVREPFGLVALEALKNNTPVLLSKQSGVSEVLHHALKADFWDHQEMVNKIVAALRHSSLRDTLRESGSQEVAKMTLQTPARKCIDVYQTLLKQPVIA